MSAKIIVCVQARMGSRRLPGKSLRPLAGKPLVQWVLEGASGTRRGMSPILLTSRQPENDPLAVFARDLGYKVLRGAERDVLSRYVEAGVLFEADYIVRICADNPLVNGGEIDRLIDFVLAGDLDYGYNHVPDGLNRYPDGLGAEMVRYPALTEAARKARDDRDREHVTLFVREHPERYKCGSPVAPENIAWPDIKIDIDTLDDFNRMDQFILSMQAGGVDLCSAAEICRHYREFFRSENENG